MLPLGAEMPPKKALPKSPVVVGTVSTRSTKRESIVNIEIIPKTAKSTRKSNNKITKGATKPERASPRVKTTKTGEQFNDCVTKQSIKENSAILDLLKDWSDEDSNSTPSSVLPVSSESSLDYHIVFEETTSQENPEKLSVDQQNLIDILEGTPQSSPKFAKENLVENVCVNSGTIKIIEESVIEGNDLTFEALEGNSNAVDVLDSSLKLEDSEKIEYDSEVEVVSKYKYSEINIHLKNKTFLKNLKLPEKKRLLQVVLDKTGTNKPENSTDQTKSKTTGDLRQNQPKNMKSDTGKKVGCISNKDIDTDGTLSQKVYLKNTESVSKAGLDISNKSTEAINDTSTFISNSNIKSSDITKEVMEVCSEEVINEEIIDSQIDSGEADNTSIILTQASYGVRHQHASYTNSVKDLERILGNDHYQIDKLEEKLNQERMDTDTEENFLSQKKEKALKSKKEQKKEKNEEVLLEKVTKLNIQPKVTPFLKTRLSSRSDSLDVPMEKSPGKKTFSDALTQLSAVSILNSKTSPSNLQLTSLETSPRTRRSQKLLAKYSKKTEESLESKTIPEKLQKSVLVTSVSETLKDNSTEIIDLADDNTVEIKDEEITVNKKTVVVTDIDILASSKSAFKSESKIKVDVKVEAGLDKFSKAENISGPIHPKPQEKFRPFPVKVEKNTPKLQTAEDILASIYNPKPQLLGTETSPSDSSNSEGKKENDPLTTVAEGTFEFEEISSSSSTETKKNQDNEKYFIFASESENLSEVSCSFGDLNLNADKKSRGRFKKTTQQGTRKSFRNREKEEIQKTYLEDLKMDTSDTPERCGSFETVVESPMDTQIHRLEELKISSEYAFDNFEERPKTPMLLKKGLKVKTSKESKKKKKGSEDLSKHKRSESAEDLRRSSRIKTIVPVKKKSHGLVKSKSEPILNESDVSDNSSLNESEKSSTPTASPKPLLKERKTRWSNAKESVPISPLAKTEHNSDISSSVINSKLPASTNSAVIIKQRMKGFIHLKENQYKTDRQVSKEAKEMICDCYLAEEDIQNNEYGCGEDCLNRLLMIECGEQCQVARRCTNKRFQKGQMAPVEVFHTDKKGLGIKAAANIPYGEFILEYVGEVLGKDEFDKRAEIYSEDKNIHHYFMSLRPDAIIDATMKGNISRFINHSCEPNAETQKWTVNGELRIGFFSTRTILAGEEITFDYQFERYGREAQKCYCEAPSCRGWLGDSPDASEDEDEVEETQKSYPKKSDTIAQSIESAITAALAEEFGTEETSKTDTTNAAKIENKAEEPSTPDPTPEISTAIKSKKKIRKDIFEDLDQLKEELEMLATTGLKNQQHTLKLSRLMVRAKDPDQRKKLLHILRRGELPCRRLFLDYHGLRLIHGYIVDAEQLAKADKQFESSKLELLQTLAVLPIQNKTILIESKVLPAVEQMAGKNDDKTTKERLSETEDEIRFLAKKLLEGWTNLKQSFKIPKKQRIEQMKEHEKEANKKFMESRSRIEDEDSTRKNDNRYRSSWSRYKSEKESSSRKGSKHEEKDKPSAEFLRISKQERRKLFALQMELKEHERRLKQREMWRQHEMNCMMIGADPRFTAPFDPSKGFQYVWNPSIGQWQALPAPVTQTQSVYTSSQSTQSGAQGWGAYSGHSMISTIPMLSGTHTQLPGLNIPGLQGISEVPQPQPPLPATPPVFLNIKKEKEDPSQVKFAGPIPPPVKLPPKWKCAKDKYGRPYYYHIKIRKSQWEPPPLPEPVKIPESPSESSSSDTSSLSSDTSSDLDSDGEVDDNKLLFDVRKQLECNQKIIQIKKEEELTPSPDVKAENSEDDDVGDQSDFILSQIEEPKELSLLDIRLKEQFNLEADDPPPYKKKRQGLCTEIIISPRTEQDRLQFKEDAKRYKANKERLKRQKELQLQKSKQKRKLKVILDDSETKKLKDKHLRSSVKNKIKEIQGTVDDAKKIKETFRTNLAGTVVSVLNAYRKSDCKVAKIVNTEDFKHLARKLTHFVMLKELKHLDKIEDLTCTESVKAKAREYIKKYMGKFGEVYYKRHDEPDFKD